MEELVTASIIIMCTGVSMMLLSAIGKKRKNPWVIRGLVFYHVGFFVFLYNMN